jgi:hypothetical protein
MYPGGNAAGGDIHHSPPTSAEIKKMWIYTSTPPYAFMALSTRTSLLLYSYLYHFMLVMKVGIHRFILEKQKILEKKTYLRNKILVRENCSTRCFILYSLNVIRMTKSRGMT